MPERPLSPHLEPTLEAPGAEADSMLSEAKGAPQVFSAPPRPSTSGSASRRELIQGSGSNWTAQTQGLLQQRLGAASLVMALAFGLYLIRALFVDYSVVFLIYQIAHTSALTGLAVVLRRVPHISTLWLRHLEIALFASTALFFGLAQYAALVTCAELGDRALLVATNKSTVLYVYALIALYGMLIPNRWQRAFLVVFPMALVPGSFATIAYITIPAFAKLARGTATTELISDNLLMLVIGVFTAVFSTHIINTLREEAYEARQLGQYRLTRCLGKGGMGEVYLAEHQLLKRPCALKVIQDDKEKDPRAVERFSREVRSAARLSHWNSIEIFDYGKTPSGTFFYVMEYLPGRNLEEVVQHSGPLPPGRAVHFLHQVCAALHEAHGSGLIHRDVKPSNIFAAYRGGLWDVAKLLDFGLVKVQKRAVDVDLTHAGDITGSPLYLSPEAAGGEPADARSDLYSVGAVAYYLLTGRPPFQGPVAMQIIVSHVRDTPALPSEFVADIPADLEAVVMRCLEKLPGNRFTDAKDLAAALEACESFGSWSDDDAAAWWAEFARHEPIDLTQEERTEG